MTPPRQPLLLALAALLHVGCSDAYLDCGDGEPVRDACVYAGPIVIEGGFACPAMLPARFDFSDATICAPMGFGRDEAEGACLEGRFDCGAPPCTVDPTAPGCGGTTLTCEEADVAFGEAVAERFVPATSCVADADCTLVARDLDCPDGGAMFSTSPMWAVTEDDVSAWDAAIVAAGDAICPEAPSDCVATGDGPTLEARCAGFRCYAVDPTSTCLTQCEALGCGGCEVYCFTSPEVTACALEATACGDYFACETAGGGFWMAHGQPYDPVNDCVGPLQPLAYRERTFTRSGDVSCGRGPDGVDYYGIASTSRDALGFGPCTELGAGGDTPCP